MKPELITMEQVDRISKSYGRRYDFARAIIAARDAQWEAMLAAPHEAKTEAEKTAYAFGWWKALESVRAQSARPPIEAERKAAEHEYITTAFDYPSNPVGSRDWTLYWAGWLARSTSELKEQP